MVGPGKPPLISKSRIVRVNEWRGWLCDYDTHNGLWFWPNSPTNPGFQITLSANKRIPEEELIKIAESVPSTPAQSPSLDLYSESSAYRRQR